MSRGDLGARTRRTVHFQKRRRPMDAVEMVRNRVAAVRSQSRALAESAADLDWATPVLPDTSPLGLTFWHLPRTLDWLVNTTIRGTREIADDQRFGDLPDPDTFGFGTGLTNDQAPTAAASVHPDTLAAYADGVREATDGWLATLSPEDLDQPVPQFK